MTGLRNLMQKELLFTDKVIFIPQNGVYASPEDNHFLVVLTILNAKMLADHTV